MEDNSVLVMSVLDKETTKPPCKLSFPHVLVATIVSFLFCYHLGVLNEPLESISTDLGFVGNSMAECAFVGSLFSGRIADEVGRQKKDLVVSSIISVTSGSLREHGGFALKVLFSLEKIFEISPAHSRGMYGSLIQIGSGLGLIGALLTGFPVKTIFCWWRICFWVSTVPAAILALSIMFCAESPYWQGRNIEARAELENLIGSVHAKAAMEELSKLERVDEISSVKLVELLHGRHSRVVFLGSTLFALQQLSGINTVFYFSSTVFRRAGVSSNLASVFVGIANLIASVVALLLMDKFGRKVLLICSFVGMVDY